MLTRPETSGQDEALAQVRGYIAAGGYEPGDRLPPERELIDALGMSRTTLRRALDRLERDGAIWRHVGKGTFVSHGSAVEDGADALAALGRQLTPYRMMRARLVIEPAIAREAAVNASAEAMTRMTSAMSRARAAATWAEYERQDDLFHRSIAEGADNLLLLALFDTLNRVRRAVAWGTVTRDTACPPDGHSSFAEHEAIAAAVEARDPEGAYRAMRGHLSSVSARLFEEH